MLNHGNTQFSCYTAYRYPPPQLESTLTPAAQLLLSRSLQGDLVGHHLWLSNVLERISWPSCEPLYTTDTSHRKQEIFLYKDPLHWDPLPTTHNKMLLFCSIILKHGRHFDYWNQPLNMRMHACYLDCHEARLCWNLVIHIEKVLHPLQRLYFHLWRIYCLCLVYDVSGKSQQKKGTAFIRPSQFTDFDCSCQVAVYEDVSEGPFSRYSCDIGKNS
jgi:hypothetical protein